MHTDLHIKSISRRCYLCAFRGYKADGMRFLLFVRFPFSFSLVEKKGWIKQLEVVTLYLWFYIAQNDLFLQSICGFVHAATFGNFR